MGSPQTWNPCHFQVINHEIVGGRTIAFDFLVRRTQLGSVMCSNTGIRALWNNILPWKKIFPATWNANQLHPATLAGLSTATASTIPTWHGSSARAQWGMGDGCLVEFIGRQRETSKKSINALVVGVYLMLLGSLSCSHTEILFAQVLCGFAAENFGKLICRNSGQWSVTLNRKDCAITPASKSFLLTHVG